jgi:hypothetical protein
MSPVYQWRGNESTRFAQEETDGRTRGKTVKYQVRGSRGAASLRLVEVRWYGTVRSPGDPLVTSPGR